MNCPHCNQQGVYPTRPIKDATWVCTKEVARWYLRQFVDRDTRFAEYEALMKLWAKIDEKEKRDGQQIGSQGQEICQEELQGR